MKKRVIALLLCAALILGMSGCGNGGTQAASESEETRWKLRVERLRRRQGRRRQPARKVQTAKTRILTSPF